MYILHNCYPKASVTSSTTNTFFFICNTTFRLNYKWILDFNIFIKLFWTLIKKNWKRFSVHRETRTKYFSLLKTSWNLLCWNQLLPLPGWHTSRQLYCGCNWSLEKVKLYKTWPPSGSKKLSGCRPTSKSNFIETNLY